MKNIAEELVNMPPDNRKEIPDNNAVLFIMCGLPFSGKSYLSRQIAKHLHTNLVSYDTLWQEMKQKTGREHSREELSVEAEKQIGHDLKERRSVAYDTLNDTVGNREKLRQLAQKQNAQALVIYTNTPSEVIKQRQAANETAKERHSVPNDKFQESVNRFEPPTPDEPTIEFTPDDNLEEWLIKVRDQLHLT
jgi:tRNA uridine 5-carbamoylmethylation protein Kti12